MGGMGGGMGGMGGGMMGGMGGGMGGMGGGMGGGFRSVPPTSLPYTTLKPHQSRYLPTATVSLSRPEGEASALVPTKGAKLRVGGIAQLTKDPRTQKALKRLAEDKAPQTIAQLVMWNVAAGLDWDRIADQSRDWANDHERALARQFVAQLDERREPMTLEGQALPADAGRFYWNLTSRAEGSQALAADMRTLLQKMTVLGLKATESVPEHPGGPALACRAEIDDTRMTVQLSTTDAQGTAWVALGSFVLDRPATTSATKEATTTQAIAMADAMAAEILSRLVRVQLSKPKRVQDKLTYQVKVINDSPLILNGLALAGPPGKTGDEPAAMSGFCLPPHKSLTLPAPSDVVDRLHLRDGLRVVAADLSGL